MALTPTGVYSALASNRMAGVFPFGGLAYDKLALGLAMGICQWGISNPVNLQLTGVATGSAGPGKIQAAASKIVVVSAGVVTPALMGAGLNGPLAQALGTAVEAGVAQAFSTQARYSGTSPLVAVGADVAKVSVANGPVLVGILKQTLAAVMGVGPAYGMMATGLGIGVAALLLTGTGSGTVTGTPVVPAAPATGATTSVVI
jgi:hypothetical protein